MQNMQQQMNQTQPPLQVWINTNTQTYMNQIIAFIEPSMAKRIVELVRYPVQCFPLWQCRDRRSFSQLIDQNEEIKHCFERIQLNCWISFCSIISNIKRINHIIHSNHIIHNSHIIRNSNKPNNNNHNNHFRYKKCVQSDPIGSDADKCGQPPFTQIYKHTTTKTHPQQTLETNRWAHLKRNRQPRTIIIRPSLISHAFAPPTNPSTKPNHPRSTPIYSISVSFQQNKKIRYFMAMFDYDPTTMSPNPDGCDEELPFQEGDTIKVVTTLKLNAAAHTCYFVWLLFTSCWVCFVRVSLWFFMWRFPLCFLVFLFGSFCLLCVPLF